MPLARLSPTLYTCVGAFMIKLYHEEIGGVWFAVALQDGRVVATTFSLSEEQVLRRMLNSLPYNVPFKLERKAVSLSKRVLNALKETYDGRGVPFNFDLATERLSNYAWKVLKQVNSIPTGYVTSYGALSKVSGGSPRAVGRVLASNPFPLLVPCHRVVRSDMTLGGYGYGSDVKWEILQREDRGYDESLKLPVEGKFLTLFPVKLVRRTRTEELSSPNA